eukprot:TRINITY_DN47389_c0_g1_i1.p2 TRINITY_DN47389_c0_g1~~TRINITY_DN47389_c0_g1_i1.p2  ORF type:complete len:208 (+),score=37.35 TRINITY_DN47389_c0_g1_i1:99-722(+)
MGQKQNLIFLLNIIRCLEKKSMNLNILQQMKHKIQIYVLLKYQKKKQKGKNLIIGDTYQKIYGWRGCNNALEIISGKRIELSYSFRIGPFTAKLASFLINEFKKKEIRIKGKNKDQKIVDEFSSDGKYTILCRKNDSVVFETLKLVQENKKIFLNGGENKYRFYEKIEKVYKILKKYNIKNKESITCLLYTSPSPRDLSTSRMPSSA